MANASRKLRTVRSALLALPLLGLSAAAVAADLPRESQPLSAAPPSFTWAGFYAGVFFGYGSLDESGTRRCSDPQGGAACASFPARAPGARADDLSAGSEIGYNLPVLPGSGLLIGAAADYQSTRLRGYGESEGFLPVVPNGPPVAATYHLGQRLDGLGTLRGKIGYAFDRLFVYGTGGLAYGQVRIDVDTAFGGDAIQARGLNGGFRLGYAAGAGAEYAISPHLSVKAEGLYYDLGERTVFDRATLGGSLYGGTIATHGFLARAGLNYRFGDGIPGLGVLDDIRSVLDPVAYTPLPASDWVFETGARYFYSTGRFRYRLGAPGNAAQTNSQLTYRNVGAHATESFVRVDHTPTGLFAKAFIGSGIVTSGRQTDEDFAPVARPYSRTSSKITDGDLGYAVVDGGYDLLAGDTYKLGAFAGYQYVSEFIDAFGCAQQTGGAFCTPSVPTGVKVFTQDAHWHALRVGLAGELRYDRLKISAEGAYLPVADLTGFDHHWLRSSINPLPQSGSGSGYFLQGMVSYDLTQKISIGVGARYWTMTTDTGRTKFPLLAGSPTKYESSRAGAFVQASYRFTDTSFDLGSVLSRP
ncbi:MAG: hypothetical protein JWQ05_1377 [Methylobacterium sp.]|nr:hypothetical protein [Methylobacterium sp.]